MLARLAAANRKFYSCHAVSRTGGDIETSGVAATRESQWELNGPRASALTGRREIALTYQRTTKRGQKMNPEVASSFANALAIIAVFGALIALVVESGDHTKADVPTTAPILAALGVIIFLAGNILRYVFAAL
jgi:hypothetical protein